MSKQQDILARVRTTLESIPQESIWSSPSEHEYRTHLNQLLSTDLSLSELKDWGETYTCSESFCYEPLLSISDLLNLASIEEQDQSQLSASLQADVEDLIEEYMPSDTITVEDVLTHFSITTEHDLQKFRLAVIVKPI